MNRSSRTLTLGPHEQSPINYHPQSGWFEDALLKEGTVVQALAEGTVVCGLLQKALLEAALSEGTVEGSPLRGRCGRRPPLGASGLLDPPGPGLSVVAGLRYRRAPVARRAVLVVPDSGCTVG